MDCVDIQNESQSDNRNISDYKNLMTNDRKHHRIKNYGEYSTLRFNEFSKSQIKTRAAKVSVKYCTWFHVRNLDNDTVTSIDRKTTRKSKPISNEKVLLSSHKNIPSSDMIKAKLDKRQNLSFWGLPGLILRYAYIFEIMIIFLVFLTKKYNNK